jgi:hypothetical protein
MITELRMEHRSNTDKKVSPSPAWTISGDNIDIGRDHGRAVAIKT